MNGFRIKAKPRGVRDFVVTMNNLEGKIARSASRRALTKASTPTVKAARARVRKESGTLKKSLDKKVKTYVRSGVVVAIVGPRSGFKGEYKGKVRRPSFYAHLVEFGTSKTPARPFLRPAMASTKSRSVSIYRSEIKGFIDKEAARLSKKLNGRGRR